MASAERPDRWLVILVSALGLVFWGSFIGSFIIDDDIRYILAPVSLIAGSILLIILPAIIIPATRKSNGDWRWKFAPLALSAVFLGGGVFLFSVGPDLEIWRFQRDLPEYDRVVSDLKAGRIHVTDGTDEVPIARLGHMPGEAAKVWVDSCGDGKIIVRFPVRNTGGALGPHWGFMYYECVDPSSAWMPTKKRWREEVFYHIQGPWYEFALD